ncbi:hypothetical protein CPC08DRAFT_755293, partial [Agrocybe pediades]
MVYILLLVNVSTLSEEYHGSYPHLVEIWVMNPPKTYGLWGITELWVMDAISLRTNSVDPKIYGVSQSMGYDSYGKRLSSKSFGKHVGELNGPAGAAQLEEIALLQSLLFRKWCAVASLAIVAYECITTFREEFRYIWRRPFNLVRALYVFAKYFGVLVQSANLYLVVGPLSSPGIDEVTCKKWTAAQLVTSLVLLGVLDLVLMLRIYALYRKDLRIGIFLVLCYASLITVEAVFGPGSVSGVPYNSICCILMAPTNFAYFGVVVWFVHISMAVLTAAKWNLTVMGIPIAKMVTRDGAWTLSLICLLFAVIIPYSMRVRIVKPETVYMWPISFFSVACCRLIMNMQALGTEYTRNR